MPDRKSITESLGFRLPTKRRRLLRYQPITFSPFARCLAYAASASVSMAAKSQMSSGSKSAQDSGRCSNGLTKQSLKEKNKQPQLSSDGESTGEEDSEVEGVVQADFEFFDPKPEDFHGIKILLQTYLDDMEWDLSGFVDLILGQTTVGTVVKVADEEDDGLFSVVTALNLDRYKDHQCIVDLKDFLLKVCTEKDVLSDLKLVLREQTKDVGLLVSQRVLNLPPQLLPPLYDGLFDEISWAIEDEPTEELKNSFRFKSYLLITKIYKVKNADQRKKSTSDEDADIVYVKPEDEMFFELCSWSFTFPFNNQPVMPHELRNYKVMGLVMRIEADKISKFRHQLKSYIDE